MKIFKIQTYSFEYKKNKFDNEKSDTKLDENRRKVTDLHNSDASVKWATKARMPIGYIWQ